MRAFDISTLVIRTFDYKEVYSIGASGVERIEPQYDNTPAPYRNIIGYRVVFKDYEKLFSGNYSFEALTKRPK